jgi:membrane protein DedA with SNARE-associated domain
MHALTDPTHLVSTFGYLAIFILSVAQSCCIPTSSELTLGFAGALSATGHLNIVAAILVGATGEVLGAYLAWVIGRTAGRAFVDRFGKFVLLTHHDLDRAEAWYARHPRWGVFGGRLVPVIRNFVALPAGVAEVPLVSFGLFTAAGSLIWDAAMAGIGYAVGSRWHAIMHDFSDAGYVIGALAVVAIVFVIVHRWRSYMTQVRRYGVARVGGSHRGSHSVGGGSGGLAVANARAVTIADPRQEILAVIQRLAEPGVGFGERDGAAANERLTNAAAAVLFVLIFFEGVTLLRVGSLLAAHVIIGLILVPPVLVKLGSTSWRFFRYYTGHPDFVRKGPPRTLLRVLAPFLIVTTLVLFASGIALVAVHNPNGWLYVVHRYDFVAWFVILTVHVLTYVWQVPGVVRRDLSRRRRYRRTSPKGRLVRLWLVAASIAAGVALAVLLWPSLSSHVHTFFHPHPAPRVAAALARP